VCITCVAFLWLLVSCTSYAIALFLPLGLLIIIMIYSRVDVGRRSGASGMASVGARAYNGGLRAESPAGSRGKDPGLGVRGRSPPPEAENLLASGCATEAANLPHSVPTLTLRK